MIQRAFIHVGGPKGSGKTAFVEALVAADDGPTIVARCVRDDGLRPSRESSPRSHPEMERYRQAGAYATATFAFPGHHLDPIEFYETQLMLNHSPAVILEGNNPAGSAQLEVFVAPVPLSGETLYVRRQQDVAASQRARADAWEELLRRPDGMSTWMEQVVGQRAETLVRKNPRLADDVLQNAGRHRAGAQLTAARACRMLGGLGAIPGYPACRSGRRERPQSGRAPGGWAVARGPAAAPQG